MEESWGSVLKRARHLRTDGGNNFLSIFRGYVGSWRKTIEEYNDFLSIPCGEGQPLSDDEKMLIMESRAAIRFGLCCLSGEDDNERRDFQIIMVEECQWHLSLAALLSQERGDSKCRLFAARLFSNLVTSNDITACKVCEAIPLSPSNGDVSRNILYGIPDAEDVLSNLQHPSWVSMLISSARRPDREALAGVTAALHNCTAALNGDDEICFAKQLGTNTILISTLLRQFVSVDAVKASIETQNEVIPNSPSEWDSATDWIHLLLVRLMNLGLLPDMYKSIGGQMTQQRMTVLPEQNVLLHCTFYEAQTFMDEAAKDPKTKNPLAGEIDWETTASNYEFLVDLFCKCCQGGDDEDEMDTQLFRAVALSSLDVISTSLGVDNFDNAKLREHVGSSTELLQVTSTLLGKLVDDLMARSEGLKLRDLKLSSEEQHWMVSLVRLIGNICYRCRSNQDRLRSTFVPPPGAAIVSSSGVERNAIHVLLSCTSFATACFTLREWGVIAIRNVLQDNDSNQILVAELDAQDPIQSAALSQAGVNVKMGVNGKVSLSTLDEDHKS